MNPTTIRAMTRADLSFAAACTEAEGWASETQTEIEALFDHSHSAGFIAEAGSRALGMCIATAYTDWGFIGEVIVLPEARQQGLGARLLTAARGHLEGVGAQTIFLDGVARAVPLYRRAGFKALCRSFRLRGTPRPHTASGIRQMTDTDFDTVARLDREAFGGNREDFLRHRMTRYRNLCLVQTAAGRIEGFMFGRLGRGLVSAGPWYARDPERASPALLEALADRASGLPLAMGILEVNPSAPAMAREAGMQELPNPSSRMIAGDAADWPLDVRLLAIGSAAKG